MADIIKSTRESLAAMIHNKPNKSESPQKTYPLEVPEYNRLKLDKKKIVKNLLYLFTFYSAKSSRYSYNDLPEKYFMEMMSEVWADAGRDIKEKSSGAWNDLQILFYSKGKKNNLNFGQFLDLLPSISAHFDTELGREDAIKSLMHHMKSLYEKAVYKDLSKRVIQFDALISEDTREFIFKLAHDFTKMYKIYFPHEQSNRYPEKQYKQKSFESYLTFMKEFEVFPKLISTRDLFYIFNEVLESPPNELLRENQYSNWVLEERGEVFKLSKFIESLIIVSKISLNRLKQIDNQQEWEDRQKDTLKILLEYMEMVKSLKKKKSHFEKERFSFIVFEEYPEEKAMKSITVRDRTFKQPAEKMKFYNLLDKIDL